MHRVFENTNLQRVRRGWFSILFCLSLILRRHTGLGVRNCELPARLPMPIEGQGGLSAHVLSVEACRWLANFRPSFLWVNDMFWEYKAVCCPGAW